MDDLRANLHSVLQHPPDFDGFVIICLEDPIAGTVFYPGAPITGKGWVLAASDIEQIRIQIGGQFCDYASYGTLRPDIAARFPTYPQADQSGFAFSTRVPTDPDDSDLIVTVRTVDGRETCKTLTVDIQNNAFGRSGSSPGMPGRLVAPVRLFVDDARIEGSGLLHVRGWVLSLAPVSALHLFLGTETLGEPERYLPRPDVASIHPEYPSSPNCGFRLVQDVGVDVEQHQTLRVQAVCEGGLRRQVIVPVMYRSTKRPGISRLDKTRFCFDLASVDSRGRITLSGWAVAEPGIASITVDFDGTPVGEAKLGISRPDVGNQFPKIASARQAGFQFSHDFGSALTGEHTLNLCILTGDGNIQNMPLPMHVQTAAATDQGSVSGGEEITFDLDSPVLSGDQACDPVRTTLTINGWAIARSGVSSVSVMIDDRAHGTPYYGIRREDVAGAFPDFPESLLSGFTLMVPARELSYGEHTVRLVILSKNGQTAERSFSVVCEKSDGATPSEQIRTKISQAEIDHGMAVLDQRGYASFSLWVMLTDASEAELDTARWTLVSIKHQGYPHWQAIILGPPALDLGPLIERLTTDTGVALRCAETMPAFLSEPTNGCICMLRAGDRLGPDALLEFAIRFALHPGEDFIYSDDRRRDPTTGSPGAFFKPGWSPDLLLSCDYIGRAWCARASLMGASGLIPSELVTMDNLAIVLLLTERAKGIGHVSKVLLDTHPTESNNQAEIQSIAGALRRRGEAATIVPGSALGIIRVDRHVASRGRVSVIIPTIAARGLIETTISGLRTNTTWPDLEIICLDNIAPGKDSYWKDWLQANADQVIEIPTPFNWSRFNNIGAAAATGDYFLFLNDDIEILHPDWLGIMLSHAERPEVGVVGPKLLYPDGKVQHAGMFLTGTTGRHAFRFADRDEPGPFGLALCERNVIAVTGACMLIRRDAFYAAGGFNETHSVINNDVDYCLRAHRAGQRVIFTPHATLIHHELVSRANLPDTYDQSAFQADWGPLLLKGDPYYNRNLSQTSEMWATDPEPVEAVYAGPLVARTRICRILAVKLDHIGDFITALPALRRLKTCFPAAELTVLCAKASTSLAALEPCIDHVIEFNFFHARSGEGERGISEEELVALRARLAPYGFDLAIDLRMQPDTRRILPYTSASFLAGFENEGLFPWLDIVLPWEGDAALSPKRTHISDRLIQLVEAVSIACESDRPSLPGITVVAARAYLSAMSALACLPADLFRSPLICIHPSAGNLTKQWPPAYFAALIDLLIVEHGSRVIIIGAGEEAAVAEEVLGKVTQPEGVFSLVGRTSLADLPFVLRACTLYIGNDSGPKHIASALGVPTIAIHSGVVSAEEWGPFGENAVALRRQMCCGPCYLAFSSQCTRNLACLSGLAPAEVYQMCVKLVGTVG